jgi:hypothetical protein
MVMMAGVVLGEDTRQRVFFLVCVHALGAPLFVCARVRAFS